MGDDRGWPRMSPSRRTKPEVNFARLITEEDLGRIVVSAHALRRFVERLAPGIPGAEQVAREMTRLEDLAGRRSGPEQGELNRYRDWMAKHVEPIVLDLIRCEGFWATDRPRWSLSRTRSDGYLQVGRICLFPAVYRAERIVLATCTSRNDTTWDAALARGLTLVPKPYDSLIPQLLRTPSWATLALRAWRARHEHGGLIAAFRVERTKAAEDTRRENERRQTDTQAATDQWHAQREQAIQAFRARHR
jgi:hypothetical protein